MIRGRKGPELEEEYGFTVQPPEGAAGVVTAGLTAREADYNPLGYSRLGVYLCRHPDISLQHALLQQPQPGVLRLIVCKVCIYDSLSRGFSGIKQCVRPLKKVVSHHQELKNMTREAFFSLFSYFFTCGLKRIGKYMFFMTKIHNLVVKNSLIFKTG